MGRILSFACRSPLECSDLPDPPPCSSARVQVKHKGVTSGVGPRSTWYDAPECPPSLPRSPSPLCPFLLLWSSHLQGSFLSYVDQSLAPVKCLVDLMPTSRCESCMGLYCLRAIHPASHFHYFLDPVISLAFEPHATLPPRQAHDGMDDEPLATAAGFALPGRSQGVNTGYGWILNERPP